MRTRLAALGLLLLLAFLVTASATPARGDAPTVLPPDLSNSTRTVTWGMNNSGGLNLSGGAVLNGGHAELPWVPSALDWNSPTAFALSGTLDANLTALPSGIGLRYDPTDHIANPGFDDATGWDFGNGSAGRLNATWSAAAQAGQFGYASPSTQILWDPPMDSVSTWDLAVLGNATANRRLNTTMGYPDTTSIELDCSFGGGPASTAALQNTSLVVNWSAADQLVLWVYLNESAPLTFSLSAVDSARVTHSTSAQPIAAGGHEMTVNLNQLGTAATRGNLSYITLRVSGQNVPDRVLLFDDIRIGPSKRFTDAAYIRQSFYKGNATTASAGSAVLGLQWDVAALSGITAYGANVTLSGPGGTTVVSLNSAHLGVPFDLNQDISPSTTAAGTYTLTVAVTASVNTTAACNLTALLDNVTLFFPNRHSGVYTSFPMDEIYDSEYLNLTWTADVPAGTSAAVWFHAGRGVSPNITWAPWQALSAPGTASLTPATGRYLQILVFLNTTNASASPTLQSIQVAARHRAPLGTIASGPFTAATSGAPNQFLYWDHLSASWNASAGTGIQFYIGDGTYWIPVQPGEFLGPTYGPRTILWRADLSSQDTLFTPTLTAVNLTWDYRGTVSRIAITPGGPVNLRSGQTALFNATGYDSGNHTLPYVGVYWSTTDPTGNVSVGGLYTAGTAGTWNVTAWVVGSQSIWSVVRVNVTKADVVPLSNPMVPWALGAVIVAAIGLAVHEVAIRRLYAIDDVFVIGRDGRLLMHNTRRMRADRDEDVLSGMLTAMISFLRDWDPEENGKARRFDYGDKIALMEHGEHVFVAAVYAGRVPGWAAHDLERFVVDLERAFGERFAKWSGDPADLHGLRAFVERFAAHTRYRGQGPLADEG